MVDVITAGNAAHGGVAVGMKTSLHVIYDWYDLIY